MKADGLGEDEAGEEKLTRVPMTAIPWVTDRLPIVIICRSL
jgi:hypothetical protein